MAGLWDEWKDSETGKPLKSCTMIMGGPNDFVAEVHDRMPVLFAENQFEPWLGGTEGVESLKPAPNDLLQKWPVSKRANSSRAMRRCLRKWNLHSLDARQYRNSRPGHAVLPDWPRCVVWFCADADRASWLEGKTLADRPRIKVAISIKDKRLLRFGTWARKHWSPQKYQSITTDPRMRCDVRYADISGSHCRNVVR